MLFPYLTCAWIEWSYPGRWREAMPSLRSANQGVRWCAWAGPIEIGLRYRHPNQ